MVRTGSLLGALVLLLAACTDGAPEDDLPRASAGDVLEAEFGFTIEGRPSYVVLPGVRYDFVVSSPAETLDYTDAQKAEVSQRAPDGARFVAVGWSLTGAGGEGLVLQNRKEDTSPELTLVADGTDYDLGPLDGAADGAHDGAYAVVPERVDKISLEIEYDGLTQTIDDVYDPITNRADGPDLLYGDDPDLDVLECPSAVLDDSAQPAAYFTEVHCYARSAGPLPYFAELGWARPGRAWLVADIVVSSVAASFDGAGSYDVAAGPVVLDLEGDRQPELFPVFENERPGAQDDDVWQARAVFDVAEDFHIGRLTITRTFTARPDSGASEGPDRLRRTFRQSYVLDA